MGFLNFLKRNKKTESAEVKVESVKTEKPSDEQLFFTDIVLEVISPAVNKFGFENYNTEVKTHSSTVVWRKGSLYIKVKSSNYPTDYPYFYNIVLGEGDSNDFFEYDWNSIVLWRLKNKIEPHANAKEYEFPFGDKVKFSVLNAGKELIKYGETFLNGNIELFLEVRSEVNKNREPYKIHSPDKNGNYSTTDEPKSVEQKQKYS